MWIRAPRGAAADALSLVSLVDDEESHFSDDHFHDARTTAATARSTINSTTGSERQRRRAVTPEGRPHNAPRVNVATAATQALPRTVVTPIEGNDWHDTCQSLRSSTSAAAVPIHPGAVSSLSSGASFITASSHESAPVMSVDDEESWHEVGRMPSVDDEESWYEVGSADDDDSLLSAVCSFSESGDDHLDRVVPHTVSDDESNCRDSFCTPRSEPSSFGSCQSTEFFDCPNLPPAGSVGHAGMIRVMAASNTARLPTVTPIRNALRSDAEFARRRVATPPHARMPDVQLSHPTTNDGCSVMSWSTFSTVDNENNTSTHNADGGTNRLQGERVLVTGGRYRGQVGTVVKHTAKRVHVQLDGQPTAKPKYLCPENVQCLDTGARIVEPASDEPVASRSTFSTVDEENNTSTHNVDGSTNSLQGERVLVIGGDYRGQVGTIVKYTAKRVHVRLDGQPTAKPKYLCPENVQCLDTGARVVKPASDEPVASRRSGCTASGTRQKLVAHEPEQNSWLVPGGNDPMLFGFGGLRQDYVHLSDPARSTADQSSFSHHWFGSRVLTIKVSANVPSLETTVLEGGKKFELLCTKIHESKPRAAFTSKGRGVAEVTAQYVLTEAPGLPPLNLEKLLSLLADFSSLSIPKAVARLELLQSTARKSNLRRRDWMIFDDLTSSDFESIAEIAHEGCGFIPREYITRFLGTHAIGKRTFAVQVRIFAPLLGVFKGMLVEKPGISKIQLPTSMLKVPPSASANASDHACIVITSNGVFPSKNSYYIKQLWCGKKLCKCFQQKKLKGMMADFLSGPIAIPTDILKEYIKQSYEDPSNHTLQHGYVVGLADPTSRIPPGHVFLTGAPSSNGIVPLHVFVSRCPCTEKADARKLPVLHSQPASMSDRDWAFLVSLPFGGIVFADPRPGCVPMPQLIANGDLDGDLYFVCWNQQILQCVDASLDLHVASDAAQPTAARDAGGGSSSWLQDAQRRMADIPGIMMRRSLVGILYKQMEVHRKQGNSNDSLQFGRAFKEALDIGKHGGFVHLADYLWRHVPEQYHCCLCHD
jgi:ribosomal protein L24